MPKQISSDMMAHLQKGRQTLTMCWLIQRTDGTRFGFTSFDKNISFGGDTYVSEFGFTATAVVGTSRFEVDNLEVVGFVSTGGIERNDVRRGLFNHASIYLFLLNWANPSFGAIKVRRGTLGNTTLGPDDSLLAELRGIKQQLTQEFGRLTMPICSADFGDDKCKLPVMPALWHAGTVYPAGTYVSALTQSSSALRTAIFLSSGGTSGGSEPGWNTTLAATTTDNDITWTSKPGFRGVGTVTGTIDRHSFLSTALTAPGANTPALNQAWISIRDNVSAGTHVLISDGTYTVSWSTDFDLRGSGDDNGQDAVHYIYNAIQTQILNGGFRISVSMSGGNISLVNFGGSPDAFIEKTGDSLGAIVIQPFGTAIFSALGTLKWITGQNAGTSMEIKQYYDGTGQIDMFLGMFYPIEVGDTFLYNSGCDLRRDTCFLVYNNIFNFRGLPDSRGTDAMLSYPELT